ncbi:MAG: TldD/PmbA family protein [Herpetosiphon sp.]
MLHLNHQMDALRHALPAIVAGLESRASYGAVLLSANDGLLITVNDRDEQISELAPAAGTVVTLFDGATMHEQAVGGFEVPRIEHAAAELRQRVTHGPDNARPIDAGPPRRGDFATAMEIPPATLTTEEKLARCRDLHTRTRGLDRRIVNVQVSYRERTERTVFANRSADLSQQLTRVRLQIYVYVADGGGVRYDWTSKDASGGWEALDYADHELQSLVDSAVALLKAERIDPGHYTVITAPGVAGTICHESFGHGVETDMFLKQRARAAQFLDRRVGSELVSITDDPSVPGAYGSYFFDDEGMLASRTEIVEQGIFRRGITDLYSAFQFDIPRSANGRRQDFSRKAYARMSNTFFGRGSTPVADLFSGVDRGVYLQKWSSGMEDPQGWGIQVICHYGREIRNGKLTDRIWGPITVTGYVPEVLQSITAVGDDWSLDGGGCGKGHKEMVVVTSGGPHLLLEARLG